MYRPVGSSLQASGGLWRAERMSSFSGSDVGCRGRWRSTRCADGWRRVMASRLSVMGSRVLVPGEDLGGGGALRLKEERGRHSGGGTGLGGDCAWPIQSSYSSFFLGLYFFPGLPLFPGLPPALSPDHPMRDGPRVPRATTVFARMRWSAEVFVVCRAWGGRWGNVWSVVGWSVAHGGVGGRIGGRSGKRRRPEERRPRPESLLGLHRLAP